MNYQELWNKVGEILPMENFPADLRDCLAQGDGLADHYGNREPFSLIDNKDHKVLVAEFLSETGQARVSEAYNCTGGYGTGILGVKLKELESEVVEAMRHSPTATDEFQSPDRLQLTRRVKKLLAEHFNEEADLWDMSFTSTGTEAMDLALQLMALDGYSLSTGGDARKEKDIFIACHGAWHGWGVAPNQLLDRRLFTDGVPRIEGLEVKFMRYGDEESLKEMFETYCGRIRAVFVEGILGDGGVIAASTSWWECLRRLANQEGARLVDDEILTGFRCGNLLAVPKSVTPDCITLGKGLGLGLFPLSAVLWRKDNIQLRPGIGVRTFNARPFQARIVSKALDMIEADDLFGNAQILGAEFQERFKVMANQFPTVFKEARGQGFFFGFELAKRFGRKGRFVRQVLLRHGVLAEVESGIRGRHLDKAHWINETLRMTPPLAITRDELLEIEGRITKAAEELSGTF